MPYIFILLFLALVKIDEKKYTLQLPKGGINGIVFAGLFCFLPECIIYLLAKIFDQACICNRYYNYQDIGTCILLAALLSKICVSNFVKIFVLAGCIISAREHINYHFDWWSEIFKNIRKEDSEGLCPIIFGNTFYESNKASALQGDNLFLDFIRSPVNYYHLKNEIIPLPSEFETDAKVYKKGVVDKVINKNECVWVIQGCNTRELDKYKSAYVTLHEEFSSNASYTVHIFKTKLDVSFFKAARK